MPKLVMHARHVSRLLMGRPLYSISGKYVILHTLELAVQAIDKPDIIVITDETKVAQLCALHGFKSYIPKSKSELEQIHEVCRLEGWDNDETIIHILSEQIALNPMSITSAVLEFQKVKDALNTPVATVYTDIANYRDLFDPEIIKCVYTKSGKALYLTRAAVPWALGKFHYEHSNCVLPYSGDAKRLVNINIYTPHALQVALNFEDTKYQKHEDIQMLRFIENDIPIQCIYDPNASTFSFNHSGDLKTAIKITSDKNDA